MGAAGLLPTFNVWGTDYITLDGTGVRDYIHVMDLADGHLAALDYLDNVNGWDAINLGTGMGFSVLEMVDAFESCSNSKIPLRFMVRRPADISSCYAKVDKAEKLLKWRSRRTIEQMCSSVRALQKNQKLL